jgi:small conductance mechanosensitive channel
VIGRFVVRFAKKGVETFVTRTTNQPNKFDMRRVQTIGKLVSNILSYVLNFLILLLILQKLGIPIMPLLAGASVLGLAVGFGAQSLVKDIINGFFIIFEDQFGVGDVVQAGKYKGTVEQIGLRTTKLRSWNGEQHIIPNGTISDVTNYSIYNAIAVCDILVSYETNIEQAISVLTERISIFAQHDQMIGTPRVLGVQSMSATDITLRIVCECPPNAADGVTRFMKAEFKQALEQSGIPLPNSKIVRA